MNKEMCDKIEDLAKSLEDQGGEATKKVDGSWELKVTEEVFDFLRDAPSLLRNLTSAIYEEEERLGNVNPNDLDSIGTYTISNPTKEFDKIAVGNMIYISSKTGDLTPIIAGNGKPVGRITSIEAGCSQTIAFIGFKQIIEGKFVFKENKKEGVLAKEIIDYAPFDMKVKDLEESDFLRNLAQLFAGAVKDEHYQMYPADKEVKAFSNENTANVIRTQGEFKFADKVEKEPFELNDNGIEISMNPSYTGTRVKG